MVDCAVPRRGADACGVLLQLAWRRPARPGRPAAENMMLKGLTQPDKGKGLPLLDVKNLTVEFRTRRGIVRAVEHINLTIERGETVGIVGESGSGKSVTSYAVMRILDPAGRVTGGSVSF